MIKRTIRDKYVLLFSCIITVFLYILAARAFMPFVYGVNDDRFVRDIVSGAYLGYPDAHMIFIKYPFSYLLKTLYQIYNGTDWYGLTMVACHSLCLALVMYRILSWMDTVKKRVWTGLLILTVFTAVWLSKTVIFTYTTAAAALGITGLFWYMVAEEKLSTYLLSGILMLVTYEIREHVFLMMIPIAGMIFLWKHYPFRKKLKWKSFLFPAAFFAVLGLNYVGNELCYRGDVWNNFFEYTDYRIDIYDYYKYPPYEENRDFYESIGVSEETREALVRYAVGLDDSLTTDTFREIAEKSKELKENEFTFIDRVWDGVKEARHQFFYHVYAPLSYIAMLLWVVLFLLLVCKKDWTNLIWGLLFIAVQILMWLYLGYRRYFPWRIGETMHLLLFMSALGFYSRLRGSLGVWVNGHIKWGIKRIAATAAGLIIAGSAVYSVYELYKLAVDTAWFNTDYQKMVDYVTDHSDNFYLMDVDSISNFTGILYHNKEVGYINSMSMGDWIAFSDIYYRKLEKAGITDLKDAIAYRDDIYVICKDYFDLDYIQAMYKEDNVVGEIMDVIPCRGYELQVYKFRVIEGNK